MRIRLLRAGWPLPLLVIAGWATLLASVAAAESRYLKLVDFQQILPAPPAANSAEDRQELDTVARTRAAATPAEFARAKAEIRLTIFHFAPVIGTWFQPGKFPRTEALFASVEADSKVVTTAAKKHWQRIRPYHAVPTMFPDAIENEERTDYSYPSGHSTRGMLFALLLAELFPENREALVEKGRDSGWLRVIGEVHYPSDVYAGRVLGLHLARMLLASPAFQRDLAVAKQELAASRP